MRSLGVLSALPTSLSLVLVLGCSEDRPRGGGGPGGSADSGVSSSGDAAPPGADAEPQGADASTPPGADAGPAQDASDPARDSGVWRPFAADSPWNVPIGPSPAIDPASDTLIEAFATSSQWAFLDVAIPQFSVPVYWVDDSVPLVNVQVNRVAGEGFKDDSRVPIPPGAAAAAGSDAHLAIIHRVTGREWDFWRAANNNGRWTCEVCAAIDTRGSGVRPYPEQTIPDWRDAHGSRACGFPLSAGLITVDELRAGRIEHALAIGYPGIRGRYFKPPASTAQVQFGSISETFGVPCGGKMQLDPALDVRTLGLSTTGQIIARALQEYGAYVCDYNGSIALYADAHPDAMAAWGSGLLSVREVRALDLRRFRVLEIGALYDDAPR